MTHSVTTDDSDDDDASLAKIKKKKVITGKDQKLASRTMELNRWVFDVINTLTPFYHN